MKWLEKNKIIILVLVLALIFRIVKVDQSLWLDESIGALAVRDYSYSDLINVFLRSDNHPPLYYLLLKVWSGLFGYSGVALRSLSILTGTLTVWFTFRITGLLTQSKNNRFKIFPALLLATSPLHVYYSQEARMYAMAGFFVAATFYFFLKIQKSKVPTSTDWIWFTVLLTGLVFTDYVPIFVLPVFWLWGIIGRNDRKWWRNFLISHTPALILGFFWVPIFLAQGQNGKWLMSVLPAWIEIAGGATPKQLMLFWMKSVLGRITFYNKHLYYGLVGLASIPYSISLILSLNINKLRLIWLWFWLPLVLGFLASFSTPIFTYFRFVYILPAFYILVAFGSFNIKNVTARRVFVGSLMVVNIMGWLIYVMDDNQQRENWKDAVAYTDSRIKGDEIVIFSYPDQFSPYRWYSNKLSQSFGGTDSISASYAKTREITSNLLSGKAGVYYYKYLSDLSDPDRIVENTIESYGFVRINSTADYVGVGEIIYYQNEN